MDGRLPPLRLRQLPSSRRKRGAGRDVRRWLLQHDRSADPNSLAEAATDYRAVSSGAKAAEFTLARAAVGRTVNLNAVMAPLENDWELGASILDDQYGS